MFLIPIRQVDAPNQCSSANSLFMSLAWHWHTCIALRVLRYATQFVTLLAAHTAFVTAAPCVLHATLFITSFVTLHFTSFAAISCYMAWHTSLTQFQLTVLHMPFHKPPLHYSLGSIPLHYVLHSLQSHAIHPLPIILRALRPATAAGLSWFLSYHTKAGRTKTHAKPLRDTELSTALTCSVATPVAGTRRHVHSSLIPVSFLRHAVPLSYSGGYFPPQLCFFWPQALLPFCSRFLPNLPAMPNQ